MAAWLDAIMSPLNAAGQTLEKLIETRDLVKFGDTFRKLFAEILAAQKGALVAQQREAELLNRIGALEKEVTRFETWEREKQRYELRNVGYGAYAYVLKKAERGTETPHWACTKCYEDGKIRTLQYGRFEKGIGAYWRCPDCKNSIDTGKANANWPNDDGK
jgi:rubrerythrin